MWPTYICKYIHKDIMMTICIAKGPIFIPNNSRPRTDSLELYQNYLTIMITISYIYINIWVHINLHELMPTHYSKINRSHLCKHRIINARILKPNFQTCSWTFDWKLINSAITENPAQTYGDPISTYSLQRKPKTFFFLRTPKICTNHTCKT